MDEVIERMKRYGTGAQPQWRRYVASISPFCANLAYRWFLIVPAHLRSAYAAMRRASCDTAVLSSGHNNGYVALLVFYRLFLFILCQLIICCVRLRALRYPEAAVDTSEQH